MIRLENTCTVGMNSDLETMGQELTLTVIPKSKGLYTRNEPRSYRDTLLATCIQTKRVPCYEGQEYY
jgi:hypothetical protein